MAAIIILCIVLIFYLAAKLFVYRGGTNGRQTAAAPRFSQISKQLQRNAAAGKNTPYFENRRKHQTAPKIAANRFANENYLTTIAGFYLPEIIESDTRLAGNLPDLVIKRIYDINPRLIVFRMGRPVLRPITNNIVDFSHNWMPYFLIPEFMDIISAKMPLNVLTCGNHNIHLAIEEFRSKLQQADSFEFYEIGGDDNLAKKLENTKKMIFADAMTKINYAVRKIDAKFDAAALSATQNNKELIMHIIEGDCGGDLILKMIRISFQCQKNKGMTIFMLYKADAIILSQTITLLLRCYDIEIINSAAMAIGAVLLICKNFECDSAASGNLPAKLADVAQTDIGEFLAEFDSRQEKYNETIAELSKSITADEYTSVTFYLRRLKDIIMRQKAFMTEKFGDQSISPVWRDFDLSELAS